MQWEQRNGAAKLFGYNWDTYSHEPVGDEEILAQPCVIAALEKRDDEIRRLMTLLVGREDERVRVNRIKEYRSATGCGLKEAKERMDELYPPK
jgi:ribosomal protein L7/L12